MATYESKTRTNYVKIDPKKRLIADFLVRVMQLEEHKNHDGLSAFTIHGYGSSCCDASELWADFGELTTCDSEVIMTWLRQSDAPTDKDDLGDCQNLGELAHAEALLEYNIESIFTIEMLATCMEEGETLVVMHVGSEKNRYLTGISMAYSSDGKMIAEVNIDNIYKKLEEAGVSNVTRAEY